MANVFKKLYGTVASIFRIGLNGPQLKNNAGVLETRDANDAAYAIHRAASPVGNDDLVTKQYGDVNYAGVGFDEAPLTTTDGNWNAVTSIPIGVDTASSITSYVVAKEKSGGSGRAFIHMEAIFYRTGTGALTQEGNTNTITYRRTPSQLNARFAISGNNIVIEVRGVAASNYDWRVKYFRVEEAGT